VVDPALELARCSPKKARELITKEQGSRAVFRAAGPPVSRKSGCCRLVQGTPTNIPPSIPVQYEGRRGSGAQRVLQTGRGRRTQQADSWRVDYLAKEEERFQPLGARRHGLRLIPRTTNKIPGKPT